MELKKSSKKAVKCKKKKRFQVGNFEKKLLGNVFSHKNSNKS